MEDPAFYCILSLLSAMLVAITWRALLPTPYPGIPFNRPSAKRILGDIPDLMPMVKKTEEFSYSVFQTTTQKLGTPIAQLLLPGFTFRKPLIVLEDPREIEDIILRRNKEFDKSTMAVEIFLPMFPKSTTSMYTTPELKAQKRLWSDVMSTEFLRKAAASNMYNATLELVAFWRLKASTLYKGKAFNALEDFQNATLDVMWVVLVGEKAGLSQWALDKLEKELEGQSADGIKTPRGAFVKDEVTYVGEMITKNSNAPSPKWAQKMETFTPRYRRFRANVAAEIGLAMRKAVDRFQRLEQGQLESDEMDTCMMDLVLRRNILQAKKANIPIRDPAKDPNIMDEMFVMLVGGYDSTSSALTWFVRFLEAYPARQTELRKALKEEFPGPDMPSVEEILDKSVPYLDATCEETFRLAGVAKANLREAVVDTHILGCPVPKGAEVLLCYHIDHSPVAVDELKRTAGCRAAVRKHGDGFQERAGRDLNIFEPRRWLVKDEKTGTEKFNPLALPSLAFGGGYRGCSGRKLSQMEFRIIAVLIVLNFKFARLPEEFRSFSSTERVFRRPNYPHVKLEIL